MKTISLIIMLTGVVLGLALAIRATRQVDEARTAMAALTQQRTAVRASIGRMEQRLQAAKDSLARVGQETATTKGERGGADTAAANSGSEMPARPAGVRLSPETIIANDPQRMAEYSKHFRDSLDYTLGGMFKALRLSPEQREKFKNSRVKQEQRRMDMRAAVENQGIAVSSDTYTKLHNALFRESRDQEAELLGSGPLAAQYLAYRNLWYLRETIQRLASVEAYPDAPITAAQVELVTEIVAKNSERAKGAWSWSHWTMIDWDAAGAQLQGVLSPSQRATLRQYVRPSEAHTVLTKRNIELIAEAKRLSYEPGS